MNNKRYQSPLKVLRAGSNVTSLFNYLQQRSRSLLLHHLVRCIILHPTTLMQKTQQQMKAKDTNLQIELGRKTKFKRTYSKFYNETTKCLTILFKAHNQIQKTSKKISELNKQKELFQTYMHHYSKVIQQQEHT